MRVLRNAAELESYLNGRGWRLGHGPVIVPTMGALHDGHARLIRAGAARALQEQNPLGCIVWAFVNPTQFNDPGDLARYPRTLDADIDLSAGAGASAVFAPSVGDVYPPGIAIPVPALPPVATEPGLEDLYRPGHFAGVCQVVNRFFSLMRPSVAFFGEKDWQQLSVIRAMVARLSIDTEIASIPTVREPDGLAMSSRNRFLDPEARARASAIWRALRAASDEPDAAGAEQEMHRILTDAGLEPDYAVLRESHALAPIAPESRRAAPGSHRALIAARAGAIRLIDNADWALGPGAP